MSHSDFPDDGLGGKIPLIVGVAAAGSDGLSDLRLLLAAQGAVTETAGDDCSVGAVESGRFHTKSGLAIRCVELVGVIDGGAVEGEIMGQAGQLLHVHGGGGTGPCHPAACAAATVTDKLKGKAIRGIKAGHSNGGFVGKGLVGICRKFFPLVEFRYFPGILHRRLCGIGRGARRVCFLLGIRIWLLGCRKVGIRLLFRRFGNICGGRFRGLGGPVIDDIHHLREIIEGGGGDCEACQGDNRQK